MTETAAPSGMNEGRFHRILAPQPSPAFESESELVAGWGRKWGAADEVSRVRTIMLRRPSRLLERVAQLGESAWEADLDAYLDPQRRWYWTGRELPDLERAHREHDALAATLRDHGVEVVYAPDLDEFSKSVFTRDPLVTVPGGAIILRLAPRMRRGEEQSVTQTVAAAGLPILATIGGTGVAEGGSFIKVRPDLALFGTSVRCNPEGYRQLARILEDRGIRCERYQMPGYQIHLDLCMAMIDDDLAVVNPSIAPYDLMARLWELGIETVDVAPGEDWACNLLTLDRRKVLFPSHLPRTAEILANRHGVEVIAIDYREINKNGGGIHCSTMELQRDW
ncbi:dimethylarginine dimethylaminohydrolase family protein [Microbacterium sp.]|uniref:dimethylarginine dimethylaminohydrolase family protein n=1 Tax=Microbacterium sp. TaxID=51671 RepID=UPI0039E31229